VSADRVRELEALDQLEDAATLAEQSKLWSDAARLWERACRYDRAATAALEASDAALAVELAARGSDTNIEQRAVMALAAEPDRARQVAARLVDLGRPRTAGELQLALREFAAAAAAFERAARWTQAAEAHERASDPRRAASCLETALAMDDSNHAARLALGALLARHGRNEQAARVLQRVPKTATERGQALSILKRVLAALGMRESSAEVDRELEALGVAPESVRPAPNPNATSGEVLFGRYATEEQIARTPTARVYRAKDLVTSRTVAVKLFAAATLRDAGRDALKRFEREAVVLGKLRHPAIVPLVAFVPDGPAVILEWMAGGSLADHLASGTLSPARAVEVASSMLSALGEAHRRGILHRDIKPANVLFDAAGAAYLADFGTAHVSDAAVTVTAGIIGTLAYMAPEQRAGQPANVASDVYGVGALLWHALTGAPPEAGLPFLSSELSASHQAIAERLVAAEAERPSNTDAARELLASVRWPVGVPTPRAHSAHPTAARAGGRLEPREGGLFWDTLLGRYVAVFEANASTLERLLSFARADHPGLASILVHRPEENVVWVEAFSEAAGALSTADREFLRDALGALHRAGGFHGAVGTAQLGRRGGRAMLGFPAELLTSGGPADLEGLERLP
jgi:serine/threonine-protein kinase